MASVGHMLIFDSGLGGRTLIGQFEPYAYLTNSSAGRLAGTGDLIAWKIGGSLGKAMLDIYK